jgi:uncharacterized protein (DUF302 family)
MTSRAVAAAGFIVLGMALMGVAAWVLMPRLMLVTHASRFGYEQTIGVLSEALGANPAWRVLAVNDYQKATAEHRSLEPTGSISVCNPGYAARILADEVDRGVTAFMPLSIGVYTDREGHVFVARLNVGLVGTMFGGTIGEVMRAADADLAEVVGSVAAD